MISTMSKQQVYECFVSILLALTLRADRDNRQALWLIRSGTMGQKKRVTTKLGKDWEQATSYSVVSLGTVLKEQ